jgi:branched-chain amino acid transport system permease protein
VDFYFQVLTNGIIFGAMFILVGLGFIFMFNMLGIFNVAHGAIYMTSGYLGYVLIVPTNLNPIIGILIVLIALVIFGIFMERYMFRPFASDFILQILVGVALAAILTTTANVVVSSHAYVIPSFVSGKIKTDFFMISYQAIAIIILAVVILSFIFWLANYTRWGRQMRALTQNREAAALQGVNVHFIAAGVAAIGCVLAGVAGIMMGTMYTLDPFMGEIMLSRILVLLILAGVGSLGGIFIIGLFMGIFYSALPIIVISNPYTADVITFGLVLVVLLFRPMGLFGHE